MSKVLIQTEDFEYKYKDLKSLFFQHNHATPNTIWLYDDNKKVGGSTVACLQVWYDAEMDNREYILINHEVHYLDTLDEL